MKKRPISDNDAVRGSRVGRTLAIVGLSVGLTAALGVLVVRDQITRHRRDLFSRHPLRRLAALGYLSGAAATVESVQLLRDFVSWEQQPLLRRRAAQILARMEGRLGKSALRVHDGLTG